MNTTRLSRETSAPNELWSVVILYEDPATRQRAMSVCDHLVLQFLSEVEFKLNWWRADFLEDPAMAAAAAQDAIHADFVVVSCAPGSELTPAVRQWFEQWAAQRAGREGALVDLTEPGADLPQRADHLNIYLRAIAGRAIMDYLTKLPPAIAGALPDSFESAALRAAQVTSVLDEILLHSRPPSHYGLNE